MINEWSLSRFRLNPQREHSNLNNPSMTTFNVSHEEAHSQWLEYDNIVSNRINTMCFEILNEIVETLCFLQYNGPIWNLPRKENSPTLTNDGVYRFQEEYEKFVSNGTFLSIRLEDRSYSPMNSVSTPTELKIYKGPIDLEHPYESEEDSLDEEYLILNPYDQFKWKPTIVDNNIQNDYFFDDNTKRMESEITPLLSYDLTTDDWIFDVSDDAQDSQDDEY